MTETHEITVADNGQMAMAEWHRPDSMAAAMQFAEVMADSDMVPKSHYRKPGNILVCMQIAEQYGMPLLPILQNVAVISGRPSVWGDMALALVRRHPDCAGVVETFDDATQTATCEVRRKGQPEPIVATFSMEDAKRVGLAGKSGPWKQYPNRMLQMRARGFALRDAFPDALMGLVTTEEARDYQHTEHAALVKSQPARGVNGAIAAAKAKQATNPEVDEARSIIADAVRESGIGSLRDALPKIAEIIGREPDRENPPTLDEARKVAEALASDEPFYLHDDEDPDDAARRGETNDE
jgi:hypothetical protein